VIKKFVLKACGFETTSSEYLCLRSFHSSAIGDHEWIGVMNNSVSRDVTSRIHLVPRCTISYHSVTQIGDDAFLAVTQTSRDRLALVNRAPWILEL
jgi:hypothetical protein